MIKIKDYLELLAIVIFAGVFLWFSAGNILDNKLSHSYPIGFFASDTFQNYGIAQGLKEQGNYRYQPYAVAGGFKDVPGHHYPILYHEVVLFSNATGIETYDMLMFLIIIFLLGISLTVYLIIRRFNKNAAILALPFMILTTYGKFSYSITFGQHGLVTGSFFLVAFLWALISFGLEFPAFHIIFLSASMFGHAPEFVFSGIFFAIFLLIIFLSGKFRLSDIKKLIAIGGGTIIIIFYYFIILKNTWIARGYSKLEFVTVQKFLEGRAFPPIIFHQDFNILVLIAFYIGMILAFTLLIQKKGTPFLAIAFLVLLGFSNYVGYGHKAFQQRLLWPIYISAFAGLALYFLIKTILKRGVPVYAFILFVILTTSIVWAYGNKIKPGSMMDPYHWDSFLWIQKNVDKNDTVYFFYQDFTTQHSLYYASAQRKSFVIELDAFINAIRNRQIRRNYTMVMSAEGGAGFPYKKSFFRYGFHGDDAPEEMQNDFDICSMEYLVFDKLSQQQILADYNTILMAQLKNNSWIQEVYANPIVSILKNNKLGEKCISEMKLNG